MTTFPKGTIPPSDMDPRQDDAPAALPPQRHPGLPTDAGDEPGSGDSEGPAGAGRPA